MPPTRKGQPFLVQLFDLLLIQLSNWRWSWQGTVITGMIGPVLSIVALGVFARSTDPTTQIYILTGNMVLSLMFENLTKVASNFAFLRATRAVNYLATRPLSRVALILATLGAFLLLSLPALTVTAVLGTLYLGIPLAPSPLLLLVIPLAAIPLAALGALIGATVPRPEDSGTWSLLLTVAMVSLGPVIIPPDRLPAWLQTLGTFSPATYAASALRQALLGPVTDRLPLDLFVLAALALIRLPLVARAISWRQQ
jgi:ABC-2 type transport system permease protein